MRRFIYAVGFMAVTATAATAQLLGNPNVKPTDKPVPGRAAPGAARAADDKKAANENAGAQQVNALFVLLDADGDQEVSRKEFSQLLKNWKTLDTDRNGKISMQEISIGSGTAGAAVPAGQLADDPEIAKLMEYDTNRDGRLTVGEVPPNLQPMLRGIDFDNNGITREELAAAKAMMNNQAGGGPWWNRRNGAAAGAGRGANAQQATAQFLQFDTNGDGQITERELQGKDKNVMKADLNGDGNVDAAEFQTALGNQGGKRLPPGIDPNDLRGRKNAARDRKKTGN